MFQSTALPIIGWPACAAAWGSLAGVRHYTTSREERHGPAPKYNGHMTRIIGADAPPLNRGVRRMLWYWRVRPVSGIM